MLILVLECFLLYRLWVGSDGILNGVSTVFDNGYAESPSMWYLSGIVAKSALTLEVDQIVASWALPGQRGSTEYTVQSGPQIIWTFRLKKPFLLRKVSDRSSIGTLIGMWVPSTHPTTSGKPQVVSNRLAILFKSWGYLINLGLIRTSASITLWIDLQAVALDVWHKSPAMSINEPDAT